MERLLFFKLLSPPAALGLFSRLGFDGKYFLLGARDLGALAPILEGQPEAVRALFEPLPDECYEEMLRRAK